MPVPRKWNPVMGRRRSRSLPRAEARREKVLRCRTPSAERIRLPIAVRATRFHTSRMKASGPAQHGFRRAQEFVVERLTGEKPEGIIDSWRAGSTGLETPAP